MSNGPDHARQKKMINPAFSYSNLNGMVSFMKTSADDLDQVSDTPRSPYMYLLFCKKKMSELVIVILNCIADQFAHFAFITWKMTSSK